MKPPSQGPPESLSLEELIDTRCLRFERAWQAGETPILEEQLAGVADSQREPLLRELLALEIYYRTRRGERPTPDEYARRFPGHEALIRSLLGGPGESASEEMASTRAYVPGEMAGAGPQGITDRRERKPGPKPALVNLITDSVGELRDRLRDAEKQRASEQRQRRRAQWLLAATVLGALTAAGFGGFWFYSERAAWIAVQAAQAAQLNEMVAVSRQQTEAARQEANAARQQADAARQQADTAQKQVRDLGTRLRLAEAKTSYELGVALFGQKNPQGAIIAYQKAIQLNPNHAPAHFGLGNALRDTKNQAGAIAAFQKAIQLNPNYAEANNNLGLLLYARKDLEGAMSAYDKAIQSKPNLPQPRYNLGTVLVDLGRFSEADATTRRCLELVPPQQPLHQSALRQSERCKRLQALDKKLAALLKEEAKPADAAERVALAELCQMPYQQRYALAARLCTEAFAEQPALAADREAQHRYNAACCAVLAGVGQGRDAGTLSEADRAGWRKQALAWLQADLKELRQALEAKGKDAGPARDTLTHWRKDSDLAGVREAEPLNKLPEEERAGWQQFWSQVKTLAP